MNILGLNAFGHDSSVSILSDEKLLFAVEERLNRKKHSGVFPESLIKHLNIQTLVLKKLII